MSSGQLLLSLLLAALKAGVLLALAAGLAVALRRAPARTRHSVWAGALVGALLVPLLSPWVPEWTIALPVPVLSAPSSGAVAVASRPARLSRSVAASGPANLAPAADIDRVGEASDAAWAPELWARVADVPPASWLLAVWLLGCVASLAWFLRALRAARRLERDAVAADAGWHERLEQARRLVGIRRGVRLLHSPQTSTPMTWGWLRPVVLMPAGSLSWSHERSRIVLLHELVHVRRGDWLVRALGRLVCSIYWLNPLVWLAARRLAVEQEIACDEEVVALGTRPSSYARHLLAIARSAGPCAAVPAHALDMARRSQMEGRLMSILDGNHRLRGGRKLAILALVLIAGLVPALAAIEPWFEEQEPPAQSQGGQAAGSIPTAETEGLARVLGELEALERDMEPFEVELEGLEAEMEPIERELESIEVEMGLLEVELEASEGDLEPFEEMIEAVQVKMEPYQARLEAIEAELEPFEERLEAAESETLPFEERLEAIEVEMQPFEQQLEAIEVELEPLELELEQLSEQMEPLASDGGQGSEELERLAALMQEVHESMEPLHEHMGSVHEEMAPLYERMSAAHQEMEPLHQRMGVIHEEMAPVFERMQSVHQELEPLYERLSDIHQSMEPVHERMGAAHERMSPFHERMGEHHQRMEPYYRKMGEIHERMRPLHEQMGQRHLELGRELKTVVERMLATELAGVTTAGTDYGVAAARIVDAVSLRVDDGRLRIMSSAPQLRAILNETLGAQSVASDEEFARAVERFVRAIGDLEVAAA